MAIDFSKYQLLEKLPKEPYKKINIMYTQCGHKAKMCRSGLERGVNCKICKTGKMKKPLPEAYKYKIFIPINKNYWGVVYYVKFTDNLYKIGVSTRGISGRFSAWTEYYPIFEIPCETKKEALTIERKILNKFNKYRCVVQDKFFEKDLDGRTEYFVKDIFNGDYTKISDFLVNS